MNSLKYYRDLYVNSKDDVVGDPYDGKLFIHEADMYIPSKGVNEKIRDDAINTIYQDDFVYCLFGVNPNKHKSFTFTDEQQKLLKGFDDTALVINDTYEYFNRIRKAAISEGYDIHGNFVEYYDEQIDDVNRFLSATGQSGKDIVFYKRQCYSYQQEYRFTIKNVEKIDHIELNIGNISDISDVFSTEKLLNAVIQKQERGN